MFGTFVSLCNITRELHVDKRCPTFLFGSTKLTNSVPYFVYKQPEFGDVSSRKALRQKLRCKSFDWYLKTIYPERSVPSRAGAVSTTITILQTFEMYFIEWKCLNLD